MSAPGFVFYPGDYFRDTLGLETVEHGAYLVLLLKLYAAGGRLKKDPQFLARVTGLRTPKKFEKVWSQISHYFYEDADGVTIGHRRVDRELAKQQRLSETRATARKGKTKSAKKSPELREKKFAGENKTPEKRPENQSDAGSIEDQLNVTLTEGRVSVSKETEKPYLSAEGEKAFARLLDAAARFPAEAEEARRLQLDVSGFHDGSFIVGGAYSLDRFSRSLREPLQRSGLRLAMAPDAGAGASNVLPMAKAG